MNLLFVCSGNTCRSPLAVAAWQAFAPSIVPPGLTVRASSAGLWAAPGAPAAGHTITVARSWGVDLSTHCARLLTPDIARGAQLICTMTEEQSDAVRERFAFFEMPVMPLGGFAPNEWGGGELERMAHLLDGSSDSTWAALARETRRDILDPFGGSLEAYQACAEQIRHAVLGLAEALVKDRLPRPSTESSNE